MPPSIRTRRARGKVKFLRSCGKEKVEHAAPARHRHDPAAWRRLRQRRGSGTAAGFHHHASAPLDAFRRTRHDHAVPVPALPFASWLPAEHGHGGCVERRLEALPIGLLRSAGVLPRSAMQSSPRRPQTMDDKPCIVPVAVRSPSPVRADRLNAHVTPDRDAFT
jgi:hypothetical protein